MPEITIALNDDEKAQLEQVRQQEGWDSIEEAATRLVHLHFRQADHILNGTQKGMS